MGLVIWHSCLGHYHLFQECWFKSCLLCFSSSFLLTCLGRHQKKAQVRGPLLPMQKTIMGFLTPGFNLGQTWLRWSLTELMDRWKIFISKRQWKHDRFQEVSLLENPLATRGMAWERCSQGCLEKPEGAQHFLAYCLAATSFLCWHFLLAICYLPTRGSYSTLHWEPSESKADIDFFPSKVAFQVFCWSDVKLIYILCIWQFSLSESLSSNMSMGFKL